MSGTGRTVATTGGSVGRPKGYVSGRPASAEVPFVPYDERPCVAVKVFRVIWTSQKRCSYILNARRWRCKDAPTHYIEGPDSTGMAVCEAHLAAMRVDCVDA